MDFLTRAKAEIGRLEAEKRKAEMELARAKARVEAVESGIARWRSLADTLANALAALKEGATDRARHEATRLPRTEVLEPIAPPAGDVEPPPLPVEETGDVELPEPGPIP